MRSKTSLLFLLQLLPACADVSDDPNRQPPGQPVTGDGSSSDGDTNEPMNDDGLGESSDDGMGGSTDGSPEDVPCGDLCLANAPAGWHGPAAVMRSSAANEAPACGGSHPTALGTMMSDLIAPAPICDCQCGAATDVECNTVRASLYSDLSCRTFVDAFEINTSCTNEPQGLGWWRIEFLATGGECAPLPLFDIPELDFTRWTFCGAEPSAGECEYGDSCTSTPTEQFEATQCIWMPGDVACPGLDYTERTLVFGEIADDRSCGECSCAAPAGTCDGGAAAMSLIAGCNGSGISVWEATPGDCFGEIPVESGEVSVPGTPYAACEPTMPEPLGSASLEQPVTVCCEAR